MLSICIGVVLYKTLFIINTPLLLMAFVTHVINETPRDNRRQETT
jgi:hypothetical protein